MLAMLELRRVRLERGWSLTKVCQLTGIDPTNLSRIERGHIYPYPGWRRRISVAFGLPEEQLFREAGNENVRQNA